MPPSKKKASYRRFVIDDHVDGKSDQNTLEDLLREAVEAVAKPISRKMTSGDSYHQGVTQLVKRNSCYCGEVVCYEPSKKIPLMGYQEDGSTWQGLAEPIDGEGKKRNLQEHGIVFAVRENHVALIQSRGFNAFDFDGFLKWLIQDQAKLAVQSSLELRNLPSQSAMDKIKDQPVKAVKFGERAFRAVKEEIPPNERDPAHPRRKVRTTIKENDVVLKIMEAMGMPLFDFKRSNDKGNFILDIKISYHGDSDKSGATMIRDLAQTLGAYDDAKTTIFLKGESKIKQGELTIADDIPVQHPDGNMSTDDAFNQLSKWLIDSIKSKKVFT